MAPDGDIEERYQLGGRERRGLLAGWRGGQIASVAVGLVFAVGLFRLVPGGGGLALALLATITGIAGACWPVGGRTLDEWLPAVARHAALTVTGQRRWRDRAPWRGELGAGPAIDGGTPCAVVAGGPRRAAASDRGAEAARQRLPAAAGAFAALRVEALPLAGAAPIGVLRDRERGTCSAVIALTGSGFALLGADERRDRVAAWSRLLASIARQGTAVYRLQWVERCVPDDGASLRRHFGASGPAGDVAGGLQEARRSYEGLLVTVARQAVRHELYLAVTLREPRTPGRRQARQSAILDQLGVEAAALVASLRHVGAVVHGILDPEQLSAVLAEAFEPSPTPPQSSGHGGTAGDPWPSAYDVEWDRLRAGAAVHASYWIAEWPRSEVTEDFLVPLLTSGAARRTLSVTLAPVAPLRASRDAEHARTSGVADAEIRRRHGFAVTARARRDHDAVLQRESELAAGHASYRFSGYLTVSAGDDYGLARGCESVERIAAGCQLELRRLYGAQDAGFLATLPIGRGLS